MMWFKRKVAKWVRDANYNDPKVPAPHQGAALGSARKIANGDSEFKNPMNITLYNAVGGRIIKFHRYDRKIDETYETLYLIKSDEDFEKALGQYIALEAIKHVN